MPYIKMADGSVNLVGGFVGVIGPQNNPNYFTGSGYTCRLDEAKIFRTSRGCFIAMRYWDKADYNECGPLGEALQETRRTVAIRLTLVD